MVEQLSFWDKPKRRLEQKLVGRVLMLGGGRQSSGLVEMSVEGEIPRFDLVLFADTFDEPAWVYEQVAYLRQRLTIVDTPLQVVTHKTGLGIIEYTKSTEFGRYAKMPLYTIDPVTGKTSQLRRQCTKEFKIEPCDIAMRQWLLEHGYAKAQKNGIRALPSVYLEVALGFGADESYRVNRKPFAVQWKRKSFPLYERGITTTKLIQWYQEKGLPIPKKSSCRVCPYHDDDYWMMLPKEDFEIACEFDEYIRSETARKTFLKRVRDLCYLHPSCTPLRTVKLHKWRLKPPTITPLEMELIFGDSCSSDGGFSCFD